MARIITIARIVTPMSSKAVQRDEEAPDNEVLQKSASEDPMLETTIKVAVVLKKKVDEVVEDGERSKENVSYTKDDTIIEEEYDLRPSKPSYIDMGQPNELKVLKRLGYIDDENLICFASEETLLDPKEDEVMVFKSFSYA